jgi:protein-disulfide isomerase
MRKLLFIAAALLSACQQDNKEIERKLDDLRVDVAALKAAIEKMPAGAAAGQAPGERPQRKRRPEPNATDVYAVPVDGDPFKGPADAPVTIVKGYEYACPFCDKVRPTLDQIQKEYGDKVRIVSKQYVVHPQVATLPAQAACAAHKQGKFEEYDKLLWEKAYAANRDFSQGNLEKLAGEAKLDVEQFKKDMAGQCVDFVKKDHAELQAVGQAATPAFYINGRYLSGAQQLAAFKKVIDEELKKADERLAAGTPKASYYKTWVLDKGLKKFEPPKDAAQPAKPKVQVQPPAGGQPPAPKAEAEKPAAPTPAPQ